MDKKDNAWLLSGGDHGWEEVPYWLKGYGDLAYILKDSAMIAETKVWIEAAIQSRQPDGFFGPVNERGGKRELWANMVMLWCLQSYYEYSGDKRVLTLMTDYFKWQLTVPDDKFWKIIGRTAVGGIICIVFIGFITSQENNSCWSLLGNFIVIRQTGQMNRICLIGIM